MENFIWGIVGFGIIAILSLLVSRQATKQNSKTADREYHSLSLGMKYISTTATLLMLCLILKVLIKIDHPVFISIPSLIALFLLLMFSRKVGQI